MIMPDEASRASELLLMLRRVWERPPDRTGAGVSCGAQSGRADCGGEARGNPARWCVVTRAYVSGGGRERPERRGTSPVFRWRHASLRGTWLRSRARSAGSPFALDVLRQPPPPSM